MLATARGRYTSGAWRSQMIVGFMPLGQGNVVFDTPKHNRTDDFIAFLQRIRRAYPCTQPIGIILDNAAVHRAKKVREYARQNHIHLIFLPPYSPELNPIEFAWKDIKRPLRKIRVFDDMIEAIDETTLFFLEKGRTSYTQSWYERFVLQDFA